MVFNQKSFNQFILEHGIIGFFKKPILVTKYSERISNFYINWRTIAEDVYLTNKLSEYIIDFVKNKGLNPDCFIGVPEGATKIGLLTQVNWAENQKDYGEGSHVLCMGRRKPKEHGVPKDSFFLGMPEGETVVIEDVTVTGNSMLSFIDKLLNQDINIVGGIILTHRNELRYDNTSIRKEFEKRGIDFYSMSNALDLLPEKIRKEKVSEKTIRILKEYFKKYGEKELVL